MNNYAKNLTLFAIVFSFQIFIHKERGLTFYYKKGKFILLKIMHKNDSIKVKNVQFLLKCVKLLCN